MHSIFCTLLFLLFSVSLFSQSPTSLPEFQLQKEDSEKHLRYLASDELAGRRTGSQGGQIAANYIAEHFEKQGVKAPFAGNGYFQNLTFIEVFPPQKSTLKVMDSEFSQAENMVVLTGAATSISAPAIFAGFGWVDKENGIDDYSNLEVEGKVVFVKSGLPGSKNPMEAFKSFSKKREFAQEHGAVGIVELFRMNFPWQFFRSNLTGPRIELMENENEPSADSTFFHAFIVEGKPNPIKELEKGNALTVNFTSTGLNEKKLLSPNVIGLIEGTDDSLKNEYVLISAHYDHVGVGKQGGAPYSEQDSIFNGARDNGMGTVALMAAAEALTAQPPKRSVILLACTAEEIGLVGSEYYVENPVYPLEKTVFNLNNDGAGYNSTEHFTVIGLEMTNVDAELEKAGNAFGLKVTGDPAPAQNLYERSDNFNFAKIGIPSIDVAPGITEMGVAIFKYYHQAADNPDSIDYDYLHVFCQSFAHMARLVADKEGAIEWLDGKGWERQD